MSKILWKVITVLLVISVVVPSALAAPAVDVSGSTEAKPVQQPPAPHKFEAVEAEIVDISEPAIYIIRLKDAPVASYRGGLAGFEATNPEVKGKVKLNVESEASVAYADYLEAEQAQAIMAMEQTVKRSLDVKYQYKYAYNGMAVELTPQEAAEIAQLPMIVNVARDYMLYPTTDVGPEWIGAFGIWDGDDTAGLPGTKGEGIIAGIIDSGINMDHPSFASVGDDGYVHTNPLGEDNYVGLCATEPATYTCNSKLIGVWDYIDSDGIDADHGSHVASTVAGNVVYSPTIEADTITITATKISGVAPHANIIAYDVCGDSGCPNSATMAAKEQAILDGVDVINYSIGGGASNPWTDEGALSWLAVRDAGIFAATSAGNSGPGAETMGSPANSPWLLSVGASTHNRKFRGALIDMDGGDTPPADIEGKSIASGYGPAEIVYAGWYTSTGAANDAMCLDPFPADTFDGEIVVCDRGEIARTAKGANVLAGGAGGYVLANDAASANSLNADAHFLPAVHITYADGEVLKAWLTQTEVQTATIAGTTLAVDDSYADIMAGFSSRGPNEATTLASSIIKPDVAAPGVDVFAATISGVEYQSMSGTSMASPHAAGAAALIRALYPGWTPAQVQSALMMTAWTDLLKEDETTAADPFDMGAGRIDLSKAGQVGFVLDETTANFEAADPAEGGKPETLNLASFGNSQCLQECEWTRVLSSTKDYAVTWNASVEEADGMTLTVEPATFELAAYATQVITVSADVRGLPNDEWVFGRVMLIPTTAYTEPVDAHFPVAVVPSTGVLPQMVQIETRRNAGSYLVEDLQALEITDLTINYYGFTRGDMTTESLYEDPTYGNPYDFATVPTGTFYITMTVGADGKRLVAEVLSSEAPDVDLFVGPGETPTASAEVCASTTPSWDEYCSVTDPAEGVWWVLVQNWQGSGAQPDEIVLATAVLDDDAENMEVTGPDAVPEGDEFDLRVFWDIPTMEAGDIWYGALTIGTDGDNPGNVGTVPVDILRYADDVSKEAISPVWADGIATYQITIQPNVTGQDVMYYITDTLPAELTYVEGSATATAGTINVVGNELTWSGTMVGKGFYEMSTSIEDSWCDTGFGGYVDLAGYGLMPDEGISGEGVWSAFAGQNPIQFFGGTRQGLNFTDDGLVFFEGDLGDDPEVNTSLPDPADPNDLLAILWNDMRIVYNAQDLRGVTLATAGADISIIEYDGVEPAGGGDNRYDFQAVIYSTIDNRPGYYEFVFAYDNFTGYPDSATVGLENKDGTLGNELVYGDPSGVITDGLMVCFDYSFNPVVITYKAHVDADLEIGDTITNTVVHTTDNPGSKEASTDAVSTVQGPVPNWAKAVLINDEVYGPAQSPYTVVPEDTVTIVDTVKIDYSDNITFTLTEEWSESFELVDYELAALPGGTLLLPLDGTLMPPSGVFTDDGSLTLRVYNMPSEWTYVLTKTFSILEGDWETDVITESLWVEHADTQLDDVVLVFEHAVEEYMIYLPLVMRNAGG